MFKKTEYEVYGRIIASALRKNNEIVTGRTHSDCFIQRPKGYLLGAEQGFLTENGSFVDRKFGLKIAKHFKQIKHKHYPKNELFSEDMI